MCLYYYLIFLINIMITGSLSRNRDTWEQISVRYGFWHNLPKYDRAAFDDGYFRFNDVCKTDYFHGFLFTKESNTQALPIYDLNGELAGVQTTIPGNMHGYDSRNMSIDLPPVEIMPPVLKGHRDKHGILYYTVTAYFKHPSLLCSPLLPKGVRPGRGLYIQMGNNPEHHHQHIPLQSKHLTPLWKKGHCAPLMGTHYFMGLTPSLPCEKLYPLFLMYDIEGNLGAFGWVFQGRPNNFYVEDSFGWFGLTPNTYPFLFNNSMLPSCMFHKSFQVFGLRIYLQDKQKLLCKRVDDLKTESDQLSSLQANQGQGTVISVNSVDETEEINEQEKTFKKPSIKNSNSAAAPSVVYTQMLLSLLASLAYYSGQWR
ncbi:uncharacterized protein LOC123536460 [Mercenaria mercenaria]|uniref:uncharacterized protein LOC123536460 n=1 Tax=Mercenaria mercenaria TaxID=6596 RepID=UPI00234F0F38|nr:uncharacterized protein LOC123536460 [Mercenaria mercenaria]